MTSSAKFVLERVSDPDIEAITLAEAKLHLRTFSSNTDDDARITDLIQAAREWVEDYTGRALIDQSWRITVGNYTNPVANIDSDTVSGYYKGSFVQRGDGSIMLQRSPALSITSFASVDTATGAETVIDPATYELRDADSKWPKVAPLTGAIWTSGPLRIVYRAGYADRTGSPVEDASVVPKRFVYAMKLWIESQYDRDKDMMVILLDAAERLIRSERTDLQFA